MTEDKKITSYYDWELGFKNKKETIPKEIKEEKSALGIDRDTFKDFLEDWKKKNLS